MYLAGKTEAEQQHIKAAMARAVGMGGKPNLEPSKHTPLCATTASIEAHNTALKHCIEL